MWECTRLGPGQSSSLSLERAGVMFGSNSWLISRCELEFGVEKHRRSLSDWISVRMVVIPFVSDYAWDLLKLKIDDYTSTHFSELKPSPDSADKAFCKQIISVHIASLEIPYQLLGHKRFRSGVPAMVVVTPDRCWPPLFWLWPNSLTKTLLIETKERSCIYLLNRAWGLHNS